MQRSITPETPRENCRRAGVYSKDGLYLFSTLLAALLYMWVRGRRAEV